MTINTTKTCSTSIKGITYSVTLDTAVLRHGLLEARPSSSYRVTLRAGDAVVGTGVWDGDVILSGARVNADPLVEERVFSDLRRALAARHANA